MDFNRYFDNESLEAQLKAWVEAYPSLLQLGQLGESHEGRPIWLVTLTQQSTGEDRQKPAVWIDGNLHATEIAGTTVVLYLIHQLLSGYGEEERITRFLDNSTLYAAPRLNPDGAALAMADRPRFLRSGTRPYPYEDRQEGLHPEDIDGDGRILQMRIPDPSGDWKMSSQDPRLMEKRGPDEHGGEYYRLLPEGLIEDFDGHIIKIARALEGLDFNRNFPYEWRPEGDQRGAGPYPTSEPEIRAVTEFLTSHLNINLAVTYHTFSGVILRPFSTRPDEEMETDDLWVYEKIAKLGTELTEYPNAAVYHDFRYHPKEVITGVFDDWAYDHLGVFAFTIELWDIVRRAGIEDRKFIEWFREHPHEEDVKVLRWAEEHGGEHPYVDWYAFDHPQLGPVELGGWDAMYTWRNPPPHFMAEEASRNAPFILSLGDLLPHLQVRALEVTPMGDQEYHLHLVVENTGYLPSYTSEQGKKRKAIRPVRVELELPEGVSLVSGRTRVELGHLEGRSRKFGQLTFSGSPTDNRARAEWVAAGPPGSAVGLRILSERAGARSLEVTLP